MSFIKWLNLQLFGGEGAGDGGGEGAASGVEAVDPGQQRLLELGVPAEKLRKRAKKGNAPQATGAAKAAPVVQEQAKPQEQAAAADNPTGEQAEQQPSRMTWEQIVADPEYNKQIQATVQSRLRSAKGAEETLGILTPALELLARQYGQDPAKIDYTALANAINDDNSRYEDRALAMGVSVDTAKQIDQQERTNAREQRIQQQTLEQQKIQQHIAKMEQQATEMKKVFPNFDLRQELQNPTFARLTSPSVDLSVEDAYHAIHRKEIMAAAGQVAAQKTAQKISNSIQAGSRRPTESGTSGQAPSVTTFDYRSMSPEQRKALKDRIRSGEKIYPGQM